MRCNRTALGLIFSALLAGCVAPLGTETQKPAAPWVQAGSPPPVSDSDNLLLYFNYLRKLTGAELGKEHETARLAYARSPSDFNRVRLAMVLAVPNTPYSDEPRALDLLDPLARNQDGQLSGLAFLLVSHIQERRRLEANTQGLQQKLDALKSLERSMIERESGATRKR